MVKFITAEDVIGRFVGLVIDEKNKVLPIKRAEKNWLGESNLPDSMIDCIKMGPKFIDRVSHLLKWIEQNPEKEELFINLDDVKIFAPIPRPEKNIFCIGKNYADHAIELGSEKDIPEHLIVFTKAPTTVIGPNESVESHKKVTSQLDYEGELAIIIGREGKGIPKEEALNYVFGYTIINDITARDLQERHKQYFLGKSLDGTCPMGPWIVHSSAIGNPNQLDIETKVNGEVRQKSNTEKFIFPIEEIISVLSQGMTLEPGDIIATGTPAGVGKGYNPPKFLKPGDSIAITIENIGTLENEIGG